jgi:hypothetical protein
VQLMEVEQAQAILESRLRVKSDTFSVPLTTVGEAAGVAAAARCRRQSLDPQFEPFEIAAKRRIAAALALLMVPQIAERIESAAARCKEVERLLPALAALQQSLDHILELRNTNATLTLLVKQLSGTNENAALIRVINERMCAEALQIRRLSERLARNQYPLDHAKGSITIAQYAIGAVPQKDDWQAILNAGPQILDNLATLYRRTCSRLANTAEAVERAIGLPPSPEPKDGNAPNPSTP